MFNIWKWIQMNRPRQHVELEVNPRSLSRSPLLVSGKHVELTKGLKFADGSVRTSEVSGSAGDLKNKGLRRVRLPAYGNSKLYIHILSVEMKIKSMPPFTKSTCCKYTIRISKSFKSETKHSAPRSFERTFAEVVESGREAVVVQTVGDGYDAEIIQVHDGTQARGWSLVWKTRCERDWFCSFKFWFFVLFWWTFWERQVKTLF